MVSVPVPSGPAVTTSRSPAPELLAPRTRPPWLTVTPPAKVLAPLSSSCPAPVFTMPPDWMTEEILRPACQGATSTPLTMAAPTAMEKAASPLRSRVPAATVETVPGLEVEALMPPVSVSTPVGLSVGAAPPALTKVTPVKVLLPANVTVAPPFNVKFWEGITPPAVCVNVAWLTVSPPVPRRPAAPRTMVPLLTTVPPV